MSLKLDSLNELFEYRDGELFFKRSRGTMKAGRKAGTLKPDGRIHVSINKKLYLLHRIIFAMHHDYLPEMVDHIDGDTTNNRIENLRAAVHAENAWNAKARIDNVSGIKNITYNKKYKRWIVRVQANKRRVYMGSFKDVETAQWVAKHCRNAQHKQFARHGQVMTAEQVAEFMETLP